MGLWIELAAGLLLLLAGGEALVRGSVGVARRLGLPSFLIGLTLVGFGTSMPELVTSLDAALSGAPGVAVGNVVGSNIANVLLILGVAALIRPVASAPGALSRDGAVMVAASVAMLGVALTGGMGRAVGAVFLAALAVYLVVSYVAGRRAGADAVEDDSLGPATPVWLGLLVAAGGVAGVVIGADLLVGSAIVIARQSGLSEAVIGLTLVAIGTSLPELATSVVAAVKREGDIALGNVIGSNLFNILGIAGTTAVVVPFAIPPEILALDIWVMTATAALLVAAAATGRRICRIEGGAFLAAYAVYLGWLVGPTLAGGA